MNKRAPKGQSLGVLLAIILSFSSIYAYPEPNQNEHGVINDGNRALLLLVIDFSDFNCPLCLDSLLNFCRMIPPIYSEVSIWGIVVNNNGIGNEQDSSSVKIMQKKIRGFIEANDIGFPLILDRNCVFEELSHKGSTMIVVDFKKQTVLSYDFPLEVQEIQHIQQILFLR